MQTLFKWEIDLILMYGPKVTVLGGVAMDLILRTERFPKPDENILAKDIIELPGGSAANVAVGLARLGVKSGFMGKVGDDRYGRMLLEDFKMEGVDVRNFYIKKNARTAFTIIAVNDRGERIIFSVGGASLLEDPREINERYLKSSKFLYIGLSFPEVALKAIEYAEEAGIPKLLCLEETYSLWEKSSILKLVARADFVSVNKREAAEFTNCKNVYSCGKKLLSYGPKAVIVTLGKRGCVVGRRGGFKKIPAFKTQVVDTTGAGDAFHAGLIFGLLKNMDLADAAKIGNLAAAIKIRHLGARTGMPKKSELEPFLSELI
jgi:ribokinase